ncbi:plasma membrane fusion protein prm1 [Podila epicladia]|nr:plasma membrane fusion protein prm1 [Podila epicladia]
MDTSPTNETAERVNLSIEPNSTTPSKNYPFTQPATFNTPFLGLRAKLSLSFVSPIVIYLLFSAWHLYRARETVQLIVFGTKEAFIQNCQDLERSISTLASFPDIAAEAAHHALIVGIESTIEQTSQGLKIMLQGILETIEFIVTFLTGTWRCFLVHLADSGIPLIADIGDGGVQAIDQLTATLMVLLTLPFNELGVLIQQEMNSRGFQEAIAKISVQPMENIEFCAGTMRSLSVDMLMADFRRWILVPALPLEGAYPADHSPAPKESNRTLFFWFAAYITHPPALTCLLLGSLGLILVYTQITLLNYARAHYRPVLFLQPTLTTLSHTVLLDVRRAMAHSSAQFAHDTNAELARLESTINTQVFGAIVRSAGEMASALENVQTSLVEGVQEVFGGLFGALVLAVLGCLLLNKLDRVRTGLVWVQNHAQMSLPRLAPEVLVLSQARVDRMVRNAMEGQGFVAMKQQQGQGQEQIGVVVSRILARFEDQLRWELPVYYGLVLVWVAVVALGVAGVYFRRRETNNENKMNS